MPAFVCLFPLYDVTVTTSFPTILALETSAVISFDFPSYMNVSSDHSNETGFGFTFTFICTVDSLNCAVAAAFIVSVASPLFTGVIVNFLFAMSIVTFATVSFELIAVISTELPE